MARDAQGTFNAVVIVDPKSIGGEVRILIEGRTFVVSDRLKRGLRAMAAEITSQPNT